ncbi:hypothetical protein Plim_1573 [Planctopirus limnophila DSM 3776]|uniref:Uncharacterized protein n=1 Tax=Planctopirus limnophila (strain ATCC 43296 / DSM 3776 / IFAM 1008 / Mu 290) TaxID=521674 RepID=D5SWQ6_PLAL2|nr:hypothetical protein [Planctopirus limnophila]ADG67406.1 hypothetical protein Plim_1573 [Planctopirus limnophila DSM 3776]
MFSQLARYQTWRTFLIITLAAVATLVLMIAIATSLPKQWRLLGLYWPIVGGTSVLLCRWFEIALERAWSSTSTATEIDPASTKNSPSKTLLIRQLLRPALLSMLTVIFGLLVDTYKQPEDRQNLNPFRGARLTQEQRAALPDDMLDLFEDPGWQRRTQRFFLHSFPEYLMIRAGLKSQLSANLLLLWEIIAAGVLGAFVARFHEQQLAFEARLRREETQTQD